MAQQHNLPATHRQHGPKVSRREDTIPAVLYGHGVNSQALQVDQRQFSKIFSQTGYTTLINLNITGAKDEEQQHTVLIREVQFHPVHSNPLHIDFYQVNLKKAIRAHVPLTFKGESLAVKDMGGVFVRSLDSVDLEALPTDLPHDIEVDISVIKDFDTVIHVSDLELPDGVKLFHEPEDVIALVQPPRTEEELEALDEEVSEDVEGVEGVEEKEDEGESDEEASEEQADTDQPADQSESGE